MCGLVGVVGGSAVMPVLVEGLRRLEYRGYDSVGVALLNGALHVRRCVGRVQDLQRELQATADPHLLESPLGIAHTRWATHGEALARNAHPHLSHGEVAVVHNGVVENHLQLRRELEIAGYGFESDTDSEVIAHLVHAQVRQGASLFEAVQEAARRLQGAYAIAVVYAGAPDCLVVARRGSPLIIGVGEERQFVASDPRALQPWTTRVIRPEDGDVVLLKRDDVSIVNAARRTAIRPLLALDAAAADKGGFRHYMLKEISEQPRTLADFLEGRLQDGRLLASSLGAGAAALLPAVRAVQLSGCGSSLHAAELGRFWIEELVRLPCTTVPAYRYAYGAPAPAPGTLFVALSQSGATAETRAALAATRDAGTLATLAICNTPHSPLMREADLSLATRAGPEHSVPSTKTFAAALAALLFVAGLLMRQRAEPAQEAALIAALQQLPQLIEQALQRQGAVAALAARLAPCPQLVFVAPAPLHALAREAALKCGEAACMPSLAFELGELRHGPLAALRHEAPLLFLLDGPQAWERAQAEMRAAEAAGLQVIIVAPENLTQALAPGVEVLALPPVQPLLAAFVHAVAVQLLAYHLGIVRGTDIDQPRHLGKHLAAADGSMRERSSGAMA